MSDALHAAMDAKRGLMPETGGTNHQPHILMSAIRTIWAEDAYWRTKKRIPPDA